MVQGRFQIEKWKKNVFCDFYLFIYFSQPSASAYGIV